MNQIELERIVVLRLRRPGYGVGNRFQWIIQRGGFHDFTIPPKFIENLLAHLALLILITALRWQRDHYAEKSGEEQRRNGGVQKRCSNPFKRMHDLIPAGSLGN